GEADAQVGAALEARIHHRLRADRARQHQVGGERFLEQLDQRVADRSIGKQVLADEGLHSRARGYVEPRRKSRAPVSQVVRYPFRMHTLRMEITRGDLSVQLLGAAIRSVWCLALVLFGMAAVGASRAHAQG